MRPQGLVPKAERKGGFGEWVWGPMGCHHWVLPEAGAGLVQPLSVVKIWGPMLMLSTANGGVSSVWGYHLKYLTSVKLNDSYSSDCGFSLACLVRDTEILKNELTSLIKGWDVMIWNRLFPATNMDALQLLSNTYSRKLYPKKKSKKQLRACRGTLALA